MVFVCLWLVCFVVVVSFGLFADLRVWVSVRFGFVALFGSLVVLLLVDLFL